MSRSPCFWVSHVEFGFFTEGPWSPYLGHTKQPASLGSSSSKLDTEPSVGLCHEIHISAPSLAGRSFSPKSFCLPFSLGRLAFSLQMAEASTKDRRSSQLQNASALLTCKQAYKSTWLPAVTAGRERFRKNKHKLIS